MKKFKKTISFFISLMLLISILPVTNFAFGKEVQVKRYSVLVLDVSGTASFISGGTTIYTADSAIDYVKQSASSFLSSVVNAKGDNYVAVVAFSKNSVVVSDFTNDIESLTTKVESLSKDGTVRDINAGLSTANELLNNLDSDVIKNVVLVTTGMTNQGQSSYSGHYDKDTVGSNWYRMDTGIKLYAYANAAYDTATKVKENATVYVLGLFQTMQNMPEQGKPIAQFFKLTASDLASSANTFFDVDDPSQLEFVFGEIADNITSATGYFKYPGLINNKSDSVAEYKYSDSYFTKKSTDYNPSLATMSLCLELSSWSSYDKDNWYNPSYSQDDSRFWEDKLVNIKSLLLGVPNAEEGYEGIGFTNFEANDYWKAAPKKDSIGVCAARKQIVDKTGKKYTLIALTVRGGGYGSEWASNFTIGSEGEHKGFAEARDNVLKFLDSYVSKLGSEESKNLKIWVTGYSRAGATANMVAGALDNNHKLSNGATTTLEDVYCYTFEAPQGAVRSDLSGNYRNIHNVRNTNDLVPLVAPYSWGFARYNYQNDIVLPSLTTTSQKKFDKQFNAMKAELNKLGFVTFDYKISEMCTVKNFKIDKSKFLPFGDPLWWYEDSKVSTESVLKNGINLLADDIIGSRKYYYDNLQYAIRQIMGIVMDYYGAKNGLSNYGKEVFDNFCKDLKELFSFDSITYIMSPMLSINPFYSYESRVNDVMSRLSKKVAVLFKEFAEIDGFIDSVTDILGKTIKKVAKEVWDNNTDSINTVSKLVDVLVTSGFQPHYPEVCLAWCRSLDPNYNTDIEQNNGSTTRIIRINCPVDIKVYDSNGELVASIVNDIPDESVNGVINYVNDKGEKMLYLPCDETYNVKITATDDGKVNYSISEYSYIYSKNTKLQNYYDIPIQKGDNLEAIVPAITEKESNNNDINGSLAKYSLYHNDILLNFNEEILGEQIDNEKYSVNLKTSGNSGYVTGAGTYTKGNFAQLEAGTLPSGKFLGWYDGEELLSTDAKYRFAVTKDIDITAKFTDIEFRKLEVKTSEGGFVSLEDGYYPADVEISLEAVANDGYEFVEWQTVNGGIIENSQYDKTKFTMTDSDTVLKAIFKQKDVSDKDENKDKDENEDKDKNEDENNKVNGDNDNSNDTETGDVANANLWIMLVLMSVIILSAGKIYKKKVNK